MASISTEQLIGKKVVSQDGREVGHVHALEVDVGRWRITGLRVKLRREVLGEMSLKKPVFGTQQIVVAPAEIAGIKDAVILSSDVAEVEFEGGKRKRRRDKS
jgi:sporulation protein YlmC with PRC-barrel domain